MSTERCTNDSPRLTVSVAMSRISFASSSVRPTTMVGPSLASIVCFASTYVSATTAAFSLSTSAFSSTTSAFSCWISSPSWTVSIPPRRRARGALWQKVTPKKLFGPKFDYDVIVAYIFYRCLFEASDGTFIIRLHFLRRRENGCVHLIEVGDPRRGRGERELPKRRC